MDNLILDPKIRSLLAEAFPKCFIDMRFELVVYPLRNTWVPLDGVQTIDELRARVIEYLSREAFKGGSNRSQNYHLHGINKVCGMSFSRESMEFIYCNLGNAVNPKLCRRFVSEMDCNLYKLQRAVLEMRGVRNGPY